MIVSVNLLMDLICVDTGHSIFNIIIKSNKKRVFQNTYILPNFQRKKQIW